MTVFPTVHFPYTVVNKKDVLLKFFTTKTREHNVCAKYTHWGLETSTQVKANQLLTNRQLLDKFVKAFNVFEWLVK